MGSFILKLGQRLIIAREYCKIKQIWFPKDRQNGEV